MTKKREAYLNVMLVPFVISAAIEFLPAWIYWPIALLGAMVWLGACVQLVEKDKDDTR